MKTVLRFVLLFLSFAAAEVRGERIPLELPGFTKAEVVCEDPVAWTLSAVPKSEGDGVVVVDIRLVASTASRPPAFGLEYELPGIGADHVWSAFDDRYMLYASGFGGRTRYSSQLAYQTPVLSVFGDEGSNVLAVACSEALRKVRFGVGISERTCTLQGKFQFLTEEEPPTASYRVSVRLDRRRRFWATAVTDASDWVVSVNGFRPCPVPATAFDPLYSTWYAYWQDVDAQELEREAPLAAELGLRTMILDDGWQKKKSASWYSATGDWMPAPSRFPDMKRHVDAVHAAGLRYMLWLSVPYVGDESAAWARFQGKFLRINGDKSPGRVGVLDPRFPDVREYLIQTYERVVRDWGFDGLKLDFIDQFVIKGADPAMAEDYRGRDIRSLPSAVDRLMRDVVTRLSAIRPGILVEFRQQYMGPAIRQYGNMIRATDSPADSDRIRKQIADLRLTSGTAAVHADMLVWHPGESPERAARPILNSLFSAIQYSMVLNRLPDEHRAMVRHWIAFTQKHRAALVGGAFRPYHPELLYPRLEGESDSERVVALYSVAQPVDVADLAKQVVLVNATFETAVPVISRVPAKARLFDVAGRERGAVDIRPGMQMLPVPVSGYAEIVRDVVDCVAKGIADDAERIHGAPRSQPLAKLLWTRAICPSGDRYIGWPTVCRRRNGELLAVFSGDRVGHICPWGKVQMVRSSDDGETWSKPVTVRNGVADDRDAGILEMADGTLVVNWFASSAFAQVGPKGYTGVKGVAPIDEWQKHFAKISKGDLIRDIGYFTMRSVDGGKTWEPPVRMLGSTPHGGIQLKSGRLMTIGRYQNGAGNLVKGWDDPRLKLGPCALTVEVSDDGARSWQLLTTLTPDVPYNMDSFHEPHLVELDDGTIIVQFRYHGAGSDQLKRRTLQCESTDGGKTWSPFHETGILGYPTHLLKLKDGRLLSTYGCRVPGRIGQWAAVSADNGKSWDVARAIRISVGISDDMGYPSTVQLDDGSLLTVYYQALREEEENPSLMATKWRLVK